MSQLPILVTGATGQQGGAVARHLLVAGFPVRALVRHPDSAAAQALAQKGVELRTGDFSQPESLSRALAGVHGVFSVQPLLPGRAEVEVQWGKQMADAALAAGVRHFIYASVLGADKAPEVPHFASKFLIEQYIRAIGLPATILRPAGFMENMLMPVVLKGIARGKLTTPNDVDVPLPQIAVEDIGAVAAKAFAAPEQTIGQRLTLVGDAASVREQAAVLSRVMGRTVKPGKLPGLIVRFALGRDLHAMFRWLDTKVNTVPFDCKNLEALHLDQIAFEEWARQHFGEGKFPL